MKILTNKKLIKIAKIIACINYIAQEDLTNTDLQRQLEFMTKIIEDCAEVSMEIGGMKMAYLVQYFKDELSDRDKTIPLPKEKTKEDILKGAFDFLSSELE